MKRLLSILALVLLLSGNAIAGPIIMGTGNASSTSPGIVELATDAETVTGSATDKATTPANITAKMAAPGRYRRNDSGGGNIYYAESDYRSGARPNPDFRCRW